jgi:hypothetical protein
VNTGNPLEFDAWKKPNEPDNYGSGEDCAIMKCPKWYEDGCLWKDVKCSWKYRPICGKEPSINIIYSEGIARNRQLLQLAKSKLFDPIV